LDQLGNFIKVNHISFTVLTIYRSGMCEMWGLAQSKNATVCLINEQL